MGKPYSSKAVKKKLIALGRMLARRGGEVDSSHKKPLNTLAEVSGTNMQIVCVDDSAAASGFEYDLDYLKYLTNCKESHHHQYLLEKETSPMRIMYTVDKEATEKRRGRRRSEPPLLVSSGLSKKLKTGTGKEDHKSNVFRKEVVLRGRKIAMTKTTIKVETRSKDTHQEKEASLRGRKKIALSNNTIKLDPPTSNEGKDTIQEPENTIKLDPPTSNEGKDTIQEPKNTIKVESTSDVKDTHQEKKVARRGRKPKNSFKACKLENEKSSERRKAISPTIFRASKRLKADTVVNTKDNHPKEKDAPQGKKSCVTKRDFKANNKENVERSARRNGKSPTIFRASKRLKIVDTKRKREEAPQERKITVNKDNAKPKSTSHVKDSLLNSFKAHKKEIEESQSLIDKSYEYFLAYLRNSVTVVEPDPKLTFETDLVSLSDPDIIAVSDFPFSDEGYSPFQANKDGKVIDLEDRIEPDNIFNSSFSKKLLEILRQPYDKNEFQLRYQEASQKKQMTRSRQLRDGREIEYNVDHQLGPSYLDRYPDFNRVFRRSRFSKDDPRALNLLRGFFFYFENIVLEGAFKPWLYEARVMRECRDIVCTPNSP